MTLTQHGWVMSQMAGITEVGTYIIEPPGFDCQDKVMRKALLTSLSIAGKMFGMVLVNRTITKGVGVRVMHIDKATHKLAAAKYKPRKCGDFASAELVESRRKRIGQKLKRRAERRAGGEEVDHG